MGQGSPGWEAAQRRILLVEDDHDIRTSLEGVLADEGFGVAACGNGKEALWQLASTTAPDLIILDLMMPVMDGWQFRISQKNDPSLAQIPVIVISADVSSKAAAVDAAAYLTKPFERASLIRTIDRVLLAFDRRKMIAPLGAGAVGSAEADDATARLKTAFINNVSHEIRTPLNAVLSLSQLMRDGQAGPVTPEQARYLEIVQRSGQKVLNLLSDILDLANVESGSLELRNEEINLASVMRSVMPSLVRLANVKSLGLRVDVSDTLPTVRGDSHRASQVLKHLIDNAIKFTEAGSIKVRAEVKGEQVAVHVSDTGIGIPEEAMGRIFEGFSQVDHGPGRRHQGAGIGLSLAGHLVRMMGGEITLQSTVGGGSCFTFTLPLASSPASSINGRPD